MPAKPAWPAKAVVICCEAADLCKAAVQSAETAETAATEDMDELEVVKLLDGLDPGTAKHSFVGEPLETEVLNELVGGLDEEVTLISCCCWCW